MTLAPPARYLRSALATPSNLKVKYWGTRGSIPCPGSERAKYGGNTSCIQLLGGSEVIVMDAGTGIRELGLELVAQRKPLKINLLLTHTHWDHIQGFPFFTPIYVPGNDITIFGPRALEKSLEEALMFQMQYSYFPVKGVELAAKIKFRELDGEDEFRIGDVDFRTKSMNHPIRVLAYRFARGNRSGVYTGDNEPYYDVLADSNKADPGAQNRREFIKECNDKVVQFCKGLDLLIADAQYTDEEYEAKRGWGHSSVGHVLDLAQAGGVKTLSLFHHEPTHDDKFLAGIERKAKAAGKKRKVNVYMAKEGQTADV